MSRKRQAKKRKKRKPVKKQLFAVSWVQFRIGSGILMNWVKDQINEMTNERLCTVRNRGGSGDELARETLISRDPGLAIELTDDTIHKAVKSYFRGERTYGQIESWDVSNVTNMNAMFWDRKKFNSDLSGWDVRNVTTMNSMFYRCSKFESDLSGWDVGNVINMRWMFLYCLKFNSDLSGWDVSRVTNMNAMFDDCVYFNSDLSGWDVSNVTKMKSVFDECDEMLETNKPNFTNAK